MLLVKVAVDPKVAAGLAPSASVLLESSFRKLQRMMDSSKVICLVLVCSACVHAIDLGGRWRESQYERQGLRDFLYNIGTGFFRRMYMAMTNWEDEQTIVQNGNNFRIYGFSGPYAEVYSYTLTADNSTVSQNIRLNEALGSLKGISEIDSQSLITYLYDETNKTVAILTRTREAGSKRLVMSTNHVETGSKLISIFYKQN